MSSWVGISENLIIFVQEGLQCSSEEQTVAALSVFGRLLLIVFNTQHKDRKIWGVFV
jgi:hypothetical protein